MKMNVEDYTDSLAVLKELIQNADYSAATEVRFLSERRHMTTVEQHSLIKQCIRSGTAKQNSYAMYKEVEFWSNVRVQNVVEHTFTGNNTFNASNHNDRTSLSQ